MLLHLFSSQVVFPCPGSAQSHYSIPQRSRANGAPLGLGEPALKGQRLSLVQLGTCYVRSASSLPTRKRTTSASFPKHTQHVTTQGHSFRDAAQPSGWGIGCSMYAEGLFLVLLLGALRYNHFFVPQFIHYLNEDYICPPLWST